MTSARPSGTATRNQRVMVAVAVVASLVVLAVVGRAVWQRQSNNSGSKKTAGLVWTKLELADTSVRQALHDGDQYLMAGLADGEERRFQLLTSTDAVVWSTVEIDTAEAAPGLVPGTILGMNARDGMVVLRAEFFDPDSGLELGDSIPQRALVTVDNGASWALADPTSAMELEEIDNVSYRRVLQKVVPRQGHLYALAWASATVDVRSLVPAELADAATCVANYNDCPAGLPWPQARDLLRDAELPDRLQELMDNDLSWHVMHSADLGATWTQIDLPRGSDAQLDMEADELGVVVNAGSNTTGDGSPVFWLLDEQLTWKSDEQPSVVTHIELMDDSGGIIIAWGIDAATGQQWVPAVRRPDGSWERFDTRPGDTPAGLAIGPLGTIYENTSAGSSEGDGGGANSEIVYRPASDDWQAGPLVDAVGTPWRVRYVVGTSNILGLQPIDRGLGPDSTYTQLVAKVDATLDDYLDLDRFQIGSLWLLEPVE